MATLISGKYVKYLRLGMLCICFHLFTVNSLVFGQKAYFIDGYHGGVWGHYPDGFTRFVVDQLKVNPNWKINIEIEPETWDKVAKADPVAYRDFGLLFKNQSDSGRIEYVNPSFAQSYMFNISGESVIRQFDYGIRKIREHFPGAIFSTYSVEEPCFTSALPQILKSFGFQFASLKNPNTCWGGYSRAFGGELVNWVGPDGTKIITVPRYEIEHLDPHSTWQTIASVNSPEYVNAALKYGITHPVGMCLQDAGWKIGPWLRDGKKTYNPYEYVTWREYFHNVATQSPKLNWSFSQEDVLVSLVWGSQILQKLAQQVRTSENKIIQAEKIASLSSVYAKGLWPGTAFDNAWRTLLLSQHHDCWIVPYNGGKGNSWADKVDSWTANSNTKSDSIISKSINLLDAGKKGHHWSIRIFNTLGIEQSGLVTVNLPESLKDKDVVICDEKKRKVPSQILYKDEMRKILFRATAPSVGFNTYTLEAKKGKQTGGARVSIQADGSYLLESDIYRLTVDPCKGGVIRSLIDKELGDREFVDQTNDRRFNEIRGFFYKDGKYYSSADNTAKCQVIEKGPLRVRLEICGTIAGQHFTQIVSLAQGEQRIDLHLKIDWKDNPGIGEFSQTSNYKATDYKKAFYNDKYKLLALFPLNLDNQKVFKDAPFDVTESKLSNTFFSTWDSIKNNVILNWVDVEDSKGQYGCALFTDHTTSYTHGENFPQGLTLLYSGVGLWGMDYKITRATEVDYALIPHKGRWEQSGIWSEASRWKEPVVASLVSATFPKDNLSKSLMQIDNPHIEISSVRVDGKDVLIRLFNASLSPGIPKISFGFKVDKAEIVELNGMIARKLNIEKDPGRQPYINVDIPGFGIRTIRISRPD